MITLDGSQGEGGGQILRSALALSLVTGRPFRITRIRARRPKPGLMRQHLACVEAAARIGSATVDGAALGSTELTFEPGAVVAGNHEVKIGSAGSTMLLLQTILPPLLLAGQPSEIVLEGGTHNPFAPPFPFIEAAFLPLLRRMGFRVDAVLERPGFYPNGGGRCHVRIEPVERRSPDRPGKDAVGPGAKQDFGAPELRRLDLLARSRRSDEADSEGDRNRTQPLTPSLSPSDGERMAEGRVMGLRDPLASTDQVRLLTSAAARLADVRATVCLVGLPEQIAQRELAVLKHQLGLDDDRLTVERHPDAFGPGNTVHVQVPFDGYSEVFTGFGTPKVRSEQVARTAATEAEAFLRSGAAVGEHLADQLLLPLALGAGGSFVTTEPSSHTRTNIEVIRQFLVTAIGIEQIGPEPWKIDVQGR